MTTRLDGRFARWPRVSEWARTATALAAVNRLPIPMAPHVAAVAVVTVSQKSEDASTPTKRLTKRLLLGMAIRKRCSQWVAELKKKSLGNALPAEPAAAFAAARWAEDPLRRCVRFPPPLPPLLRAAQFGVTRATMELIPMPMTGGPHSSSAPPPQHSLEKEGLPRVGHCSFTTVAVVGTTLSETFTTIRSLIIKRWLVVAGGWAMQWRIRNPADGARKTKGRCAYRPALCPARGLL